jgi:hydrogenase maturation protein HypF
LLSRTYDLLTRSGFEVHTHSQVPPNDGGLSLGQAVVANQRILK